MLICPQCGFPSEQNELIKAPRDAECTRCTWKGKSQELIYMDDNLAGVKDFQGRMERFYVSMATMVAPLIGKLLLDEKLIPSPKDVEGDERDNRIQLVARILQATTNGAVQAAVTALSKEMSDGWPESTGKPVHRTA